MVTSVDVVNAGTVGTPVVLGADSSEATRSVDELSCAGTTGPGAWMLVVGSGDAAGASVMTTGDSVVGVGRTLVVVNGAAGIVDVGVKKTGGSVGPLSSTKVAVLLTVGVCSIGLVTGVTGESATEEVAASLELMSAVVLLVGAGVVLSTSELVVG